MCYRLHCVVFKQGLLVDSSGGLSLECRAREQKIPRRRAELEWAFIPVFPPPQVVCRVSPLAVGGRKARAG